MLKIIHCDKEIMIFEKVRRLPQHDMIKQARLGAEEQRLHDRQISIAGVQNTQDEQADDAGTLVLPGVNPLKATVLPRLMHTGLIRWELPPPAPRGGVG